MFSYEHDDDYDPQADGDYTPAEVRAIKRRERDSSYETSDPRYREPVHEPAQCRDADCELCEEHAAEQQGDSPHFRDDSSTTDTLSH